MAKPKKFPEYITVTRETLVGGDEFMRVREDGIDDPDIDDARPFAVYKLQSAGTVHVTRTYVPNQPRPKKR